MSTPSLSLNIDALNGINVSNSSSSGQIVLRTNTIPKSLLDSSNNNTLLSVKGDLDISGNLTNNTITNMKNDITNLQLGNVTMSDNQRNLLSNNLEATTVNLIEPSGNFNTLTSITKRWNNEILTHPVSLLGLNNNIPAIATSKNNLANNYSIITNHSSSDISNTDLSGNQIINLFSTNDTFFVKNSKEETSYIKQYSISNSGSFVFWNLQTLVDRGAELKSEIDFQNMFGENATIANELLRMKNDSVINWEDIYIVGNNNPSVKALGNAESNIAGYANGQTIDYYVNQMQNNVAITNYFTPGNVLTDVVDQNDDDINSDFIISGILESVNNIKSNKIWLYIPGLAGKEYRDHNNLLLFPIKSKVLYLCSEGEFTNNTNYKEKYGLSIIDTDKFLLSYTNNIKISNVDSSLYFNNNSGRYKINYFKKDTVSDYTQPFGLNDSSGNDIDIVKVHKFKCQVQLLLYNNGVANSKIIANELKTTDNKNTDIDITYTGSNYKDFIDLINSNIYLYKPLLIINGITVFITSATLAGQSENGQDKYALTFSRVQNDISSWIGTPNQLLLSADKSTDIYPIFSSFVTFRYKQNTNNVYTIPNNVTTIIVPNFITEWDITNVNNYSIYNVTTGSNNSVWYNSPVNNNNGEWIDYVKIPNHFIYNSQNTTWKKGNNLIYYNNNVGIGTDNPTEKLHIEGNVVITGQILTSGQTTVLDSSNITINDPITVLAANNIANILDIGIVGKYNDGVSKFAGLIRDATDNVFKLFDSTTENLLSKNVVTFGANSINMADLYVGQLGLEDINNSNILKLKWNEDDNTDRTLNIKVVNSDRILNLGGDLIVETNSKVNQDLTTDSSVTFNKITLTSGAQDGYILQSDANGVGNWNTLNSISSGSILVNCDSTNNVIDISGSIIPKTNETFDLGSSDKKFRHLFLSNNSLWIGDTHKISVSSDGNLKFRKRITNTVPQTILDAGGTESGLKTFTSKTNLSDITLDELLKYMRTLPNKQNSTVDDIFRDNNNDYSENTESGKLKTYEDNTNQDYYIPFTKTLSGDVDVATNNNFRFNPSLGKIKANDLEISTIKITSSAQNGYVLKSDANGVGTWQQETIPTYISSGDTIVGTVDTTSNEHIYFNVNNNTKMRIWGSGVVNIYNTLDTVGFKMVTNAQNGYVLKSDANGVGTWQQEYNYTLPTASSTVLGGIKVGNNLSIDGNGILSAIQGTYTLPTASASILGGIKVGNNLSIDSSGILSATANGNSISSGDTTIGTVDTTNNEHIYFNVNNNTKMRIWDTGVVNIYNTLDTVGFKMVTNAQNGYVLKTDASGVGTWQQEYNYTLPTASSSVLGGIKVGNNLSIDGNGILSAIQGTYTLPTASSSVLGGIKVGNNLSIDSSGILSATANGNTISSGDTTIGTVDTTNNEHIYFNVNNDTKMRIWGSGVVNIYNTLDTVGFKMITNSQDGYVLKSDANGVGTWQQEYNYTLPTASASTLGGIKVGNNLSIDNGVLSAIQGTYTLPTASASILGGIKVGNNLSIDSSGVLSAVANGNSISSGDTTIGTVDTTNNEHIYFNVNNNTKMRIWDSGLVNIYNTLDTVGFKMVTNAQNGYVLKSDANGVGTWQQEYNYTLPTASSSVLGGIKVGNNLSIDNGVLSAIQGTYTLPTASSSVLGGIKVGNNLSIDGNGVLSATANGNSISSGDTTIGTVDTTNNEHIYFNVNNNTKMRIWGSGVVNIYNTLDTVGFKMVTNAQNGYVLKSDANGVGTWQPESANVWSINGSRIFYNTDNVGIGVTNPNDKLDISGGNININSSPSTTIIQPINPTGSPPYWYQGKDSNYVTNYTGSNHYVVPTTSGISTSENFYAYFKFKSTSTGHEPLLYDGDTYKFGLQLNVGTGSDGWMLPFVDSSSPYNIPFTNYRQEFINLGQTIPNFFVTNTEYEVLVHYNLTVGQVSFKMYFKQDYGNQGSLNPYHLILTYDTNNISASVNNYVSQSLNTVTFTSQGLYLGRQAGGNFFNGTIDRFAFFILGNYQLTSSQIDQIFNRGSYTSSIYSYGPTSDEVSNTTYKGLKLNSDNEGVYSDASNIYLKSGGNSIKFPRTSGSNGEILKISNVSNNITTLDWSADSTSDSRLKKDILNCCYGLEDLIKMRPITFKWNDNAIFKDNRTRVGLIAEEVEEIIPEIVGTDSRNNKYIEYNQITSVMIKAIQELKEKNDKLEKDKNDLKLEISNILSRLDNAGL